MPDMTQGTYFAIADRENESIDSSIAAQRQADSTLLRLARDRKKHVEDVESEWRIQSTEDNEFSAGNQWPQMDVWDPKRIQLTINQIPKYLHQITNDARQNHPAIVVHPVDSGSDPETAKIYQGLIKHIEVDSSADMAYTTAIDHAARIGRGYFRILTEYDHPFGFDLCIKIQRILNPWSVYIDPIGRHQPDYHTADWGFVVERMAKDRFCELYEIDASTYGQWQGEGDTWIERDEVQVAEYFYRERHPLTLSQLSDGQIRFSLLPEDSLEERTEYAAILDNMQQQLFRRGIAPLAPEEQRYVQRERRSAVPIIHWCKINGHSVLERTIWPGQYIPIVPVLGEELLVDGKIDYRGIVRDLKDSQRMYNYWATKETETIALAPKAPWVGYKGQFASRERDWARANTANLAYLEADPLTINGQLAPLPQRNVFEPPIQAISAARAQAMGDMHAVTGIYPAAQGSESNEVSGVGIRQRQGQSQLGSYHFFSNLSRAIRHAGTILVDLIPAVYTAQRIVRILGEDGTPRMVMLQPGTAGQPQPKQLPKGIEGIYDIQVGRYDVTIEAGPGYATKRQEAAVEMARLTTAYPQLMQVGGDILVGNQDWPGAEQLAARLKKTIPPELLDEPGTDPEAKLAQLQGLIPQLQQQCEALNAYAKGAESQLQVCTNELSQLKADRQLDIEKLAIQRDELHQRLQVELASLDVKREELAVKRLELAARMNV